jgi:hypothetical protein
MNPRIQEALARKFGLSDEERAALQSGDASVLLSRGLAGASDPMQLLLMATMMQGQNQESDRPELDHERTIARARAVIRRLRDELSAAETMVQYVAQVFGACPACLGQNRLCLRCSGSGEAGSSDPAEEELLRWVTPALRKVGKRVAPLERTPEPQARQAQD